MTTTIRRFGVLFALAFAVTMLYTAYWAIVRRDALLEREDNPRQVLRAERIQRGTIFDRDGEVLAESRINPETGIADRVYPAPEAAPVVGYYSLRFGEGGIEAAFNELLTGEAALTPGELLAINVLQRPLEGGDVRLTIDRDLQVAIERLLLGYTGAIVVMDAATGEILAMGSQPSYDPNMLDERWGDLSEDPAAPLLNRTTQSQYQPGTMMVPVVSAAVIAQNADALDAAWLGDTSIPVDGVTLGCAVTPPEPPSTLREGLVWGCPAPLAALTQDLGGSALVSSLETFGLTDAPEVSIAVADTAFDLRQPSNTPGVLAVGQGGLLLSPLQMAAAISTFAVEGAAPTPVLVDAVRGPDGGWEPIERLAPENMPIDPGAQAVVRALLRDAITQGAAQAAAIPGAEVHGQTGLAVAGEEFIAWFAGFADAPDGTPVVVTVVLEDSRATLEAASLGRETLLLTMETLD